ncbi:YhcH/YjgK/YiaL family protein [Aliarcobacter butzleri]|uniref:YhcH/YjgK/YiaL family protein n=1 Tax=Aliarcobacter butzleri TaxID=28197 RepID=UPI0021B29409|nr:YhcH/YjgK/YiaL family protein [Aliarcobacter butzleri]MCT7584803.1 YhcH/YjgK/YiaL family protein [Aliarcobacter butzleri]
MAIIGNIYKLENFLNKKELKIVFNYFKEAINKNSEIHKRIFTLPIGSFEKVNITEDIFALEQVFYTKNRENCFIESHKRYIDFQLILSGSEQMEYIDIDKLEIENFYDEKKDLITYKLVDNTSKFLLQENDLAIFFPDDAHIGLPKFKSSELVYKTVIKFPISKWRN